MRRIMKTHCAKHHGQNDSSTQISSNCLPLAPWVPHLVVLKIKMIICFPSSHIVTCYSRGEVSLTLFLIIFSPIDPSFAHFLINSAKVRPIFQCLAYLISIWKDDDALLMVFVPLQMMPCWLWWWLVNFHQRIVEVFFFFHSGLWPFVCGVNASQDDDDVL